MSTENLESVFAMWETHARVSAKNIAATLTPKLLGLESHSPDEVCAIMEQASYSLIRMASVAALRLHAEMLTDGFGELENRPTGMNRLAERLEAGGVVSLATRWRSEPET